MKNMANKQLIKDSLGWGIVLWLIGYVLSFILFFIVPPSFIGWAIMPVGIVITLWVLFKRIRSEYSRHYLVLAIAWTMIAVVLDYLLVVKALNPVDGYYKPAVYLYYALTFVLPLLVGWRNKSKSNGKVATQS